MKVALVQVCSSDDMAGNTERACALGKLAAERGNEWVLFPENVVYLGDGSPEIAEELTGPRLRPYLDLAAAFGLWVTVGSFPERASDSGRHYNSQVLIDPTGKIASVYRKIHLFDVCLPSGVVFRESDRIVPGNDPVSACITSSSGEWKLGMTTCYDLRFPELFRHYLALGAHIITVPSAFTFESGAAHWHALLRARAIENQVYILAPNQYGKHGGGRHSFGNSAVYDPWGTMVGCAQEGETLVEVVLDKEYLMRIRSQLPVLKHRQLV